MILTTRRRLWFVVFVLVVFAIGIGTGLTIDRYALGARPGFRGPGRGPQAADIAQRMARDLELDAQQQQQLEGVFQRAATRLEKFRRESRQQFTALRDQLDGEIEAILTPEQRQEFRETRRRNRRRPAP